MKNILSIIAAFFCISLLAADRTTLQMPLQNFRTYKNKDAAGIVNFVAKSAENPMTRRQFIADTSSQKYLIQLYGHDPAVLTDTKNYTLTVTVSDDINPEAELSFALKSKNKKYAWYGYIRAKIDAKKLTPGKHTFTTGIDLKNVKNLPELGYICPTITVRSLKNGTVMVESVEVITLK